MRLNTREVTLNIEPLGELKSFSPEVNKISLVKSSLREVRLSHQSDHSFLDFSYLVLELVYEKIQRRQERLRKTIRLRS